MAFYPDGSFTMGHPAHHSMYFPRAQYPGYMHQQPPPEMMYQNYQFQDFPDFLQPGMMHDDFDDSSEVSTRPRLTKDQVEVLEAQFLSHPKPNSMVKKQLAMQTKLTLPRVANWFQNRRAKAKQQRKQEEYEIQQNLGMNTAWRGENGLVSRKQSPSETSVKTVSPGKYRPIPVMNSASQDLTESHSPVNFNDSTKEASWQSLQRALNAAKAAQRQRPQEPIQAVAVIPAHDMPISASSFGQFQAEPHTSRSQTAATPVEWTTKADNVNDWASSPNQSHAGFDFGFDQPTAMSTHQDLLTEESNGQDAQQFNVSPEDWPSSYSAETPQAPQQSDYGSMVSPPMSLPVYPPTRRGSGAEDLTDNFGSFALQGTPPTNLAHLNKPLPPRPTEGDLDIASRRKRPRPAALTSSSLRSRSYGALSSAAHAFKSGSLNNGQLRHAKSAGHGLNTQYSGIRKSSIQQKSPFNIHSFAEADAAKTEAFENLMAHRVLANGSSTPQTAVPATDITMQGSARFAENAITSMQPPCEVMPPYKQIQSPPITPFQQEFMMQASGIGMQSNASSSQFANFADYTPPYSAGPLTNSTCSWSDAPLHSPDISVFPSGTFMSSLGFNQDSAFPQWVIPSDHANDTGMSLNMTDDKKTEFYITEFPGQKEEHLNVFQKLSQQKPKNYVFANTAPSDYDS